MPLHYFMRTGSKTAVIYYLKFLAPGKIFSCACAGMLVSSARANVSTGKSCVCEGVKRRNNFEKLYALLTIT